MTSPADPNTNVSPGSASPGPTGAPGQPRSNPFSRLTAKYSPATLILGTLGAFFLVGLLLIISFVVALNGNQKEMVKKETALSAQYNANQNELSTYVSTIKETLGVANSSTAALDQVLVDAVKGRYEGNTSAQPGGGQLFSAITEAYPDLSANTVLYAKVQDAVMAGRNNYRDVQNKLLDMLRSYDTWRNSGFIHSKMVSLVGAPSNNLRASIGDDVVTGESAEARMYRIVLASDAAKAYQTGVMDPLDLGPNSPATPR